MKNLLATTSILLALSVPAMAAKPLTAQQMDKVTAGWNGASAGFFSSVLATIAANPGAVNSVSTSSSSSP